MDASVLGSVGVGRSGHQSNISGALDDGCIVARELVLVQQVTDLHLNQLEELFVVNLVGLVHEYYDIGNANLTGEQDVLTSLGHRTISSGNNKDSAIHLSSTGDHVLDIVSMAGAVNVSIVTLSSLVLNVSGIDCDTTLSLFGSLIDVCIINEVSRTAEVQNLCDSSSQSCLTMVNVTDGTDVYMGLISFELLSCHWKKSSFNC